MKVAPEVSPLAAVAAAMGTLACCVPLGFFGAFGLAAGSVWLSNLHWWLLGASLCLLAVGFAQLRGRRACRRRRFSTLILWIAAAVVVTLLLFPQSIAAWLAG